MRGPGRRPHPKKKASFDLPACLRRRRGALRAQRLQPAGRLARRPAGGLVSRQNQQVCCQKNKLDTSLQQSSRVGQRGAAQARPARAPRERKGTHQLACAAPVARPARACIQACWAPASPTLYQYHLLYYGRDYVFSCPHNSLGSNTRAFSQ